MRAVKLCSNKILPILNWGCWLMQVVLYNGRKTIVVVACFPFCVGRRRRSTRRRIRAKVWWICWSRCTRTAMTRWSERSPSHGASHAANKLEWISSCTELSLSFSLSLLEQFRCGGWNVKLHQLFSECLPVTDSHCDIWVDDFCWLLCVTGCL